MKRFIPVLMIVLLTFSGCSKYRTADCEEILVKMLSYTEAGTRQNGQVFIMSAHEGSNEYFSKENKAILYGSNAVEHSFPKIEDCAIFISARFPEEIAVFKCYARSDIDDVVKMCVERSDELKVALRDSEWNEKAQKIKITAYGRYVLMLFTNEVEKQERIFRSVV